jgi:hypothetical protein
VAVHQILQHTTTPTVALSAGAILKRSAGSKVMAHFLRAAPKPTESIDTNGWSAFGKMLALEECASSGMVVYPSTCPAQSRILGLPLPIEKRPEAGCLDELAAPCDCAAGGISLALKDILLFSNGMSSHVAFVTLGLH